MVNFLPLSKSEEGKGICKKSKIFCAKLMWKFSIAKPFKYVHSSMPGHWRSVSEDPTKVYAYTPWFPADCILISSLLLITSVTSLRSESF
jgi:hypothetical protein